MITKKQNKELIDKIEGRKVSKGTFKIKIREGERVNVVNKGSNVAIFYDKEPTIIEAEEGDDFQEYIFDNGEKVDRGTPIGVEIYNPRTEEWELHLFEDIKFRNDF
jgi:hypothetical protein